jgi:hypothetical protein
MAGTQRGQAEEPAGLDEAHRGQQLDRDPGGAGRRLRQGGRVDREKMESAAVGAEPAQPRLDHCLPGDAGVLDGLADQDETKSGYIDLAVAEADLSTVVAVAIDETSCRRGHDYLTTAAGISSHRFAIPQVAGENLLHQHIRRLEADPTTRVRRWTIALARSPGARCNRSMDRFSVDPKDANTTGRNNPAAANASTEVPRST